jgi:L-ascorbate metabolism protein UlaG (beta-lactamase superfamily)
MRAFSILVICTYSSLSVSGCTSKPAVAPEQTSTKQTRAPKQSSVPKQALTMTYLGVAGWQLDSAGKTILVDPYFSRPKLDGPIASDPEAVALRSPKRADLIVIGHSHVDHLLDAPAVALATGAQIMGSDSTARVARAAGVAADHVIPIKGGEDYAFDGFSVRAIPSLHSVIDRHTLGGPITVMPPVEFDDWAEGGTFNYVVRVGGHEIFVSSTANFIERELVGVDPDIAIIATGLRNEVHDYTCRLLTALGKPPLVYTTHFDNWRGPPVDEPLSKDLEAFIAEVRACSPATRVVVPKHFEPMPVR